MSLDDLIDKSNTLAAERQQHDEKIRGVVTEIVVAAQLSLVAPKPGNDGRVEAAKILVGLMDKVGGSERLIQITPVAEDLLVRLDLMPARPETKKPALSNKEQLLIIGQNAPKPSV